MVASAPSSHASEPSTLPLPHRGAATGLTPTTPSGPISIRAPPKRGDVLSAEDPEVIPPRCVSCDVAYSPQAERLRVEGQGALRARAVRQKARHEVDVPEPLKEFAAILFGGDSSLMMRWPWTKVAGTKAFDSARRSASTRALRAERWEMVEMRGLEPLTPAMRTRCSPS